MLLRIVRMEFEQEKVDDFLEVFYNSKPTIEKFEGCHKVDLYKDSQQVNVFYTYSLWDNEDQLNAYRNSDFFKGTWAKTKKLFSGKPAAYSLIKD